MNKNGEKLDKYCLVSSGGTPSKKNLSYYENGSILWATIADMEKSDGIVLDTKLKITEKGLSSIGNRIFPKDTLFLAMYGSVGKVAIAGKEMAVNQAILGIQPKNENEIFIPYLKYWLMHNKPKIVNKARGGILKNLSAKIVKNIKIELPSYSDQKKIANLLTQVETLIAKREESIELLDELLRSSFLDMFGTDINNTQKHPVVSLSEVSNKITDGTHQSPKFQDSGIPFLLVSNIKNNEITYTTQKYISDEEYEKLSKRTPIEIGNILLTTVGSYGNPAIIKSTKKFAFQRHIAFIQPNHEIVNYYYLFAMLKSPIVKNQIEKKVKGVAQKTLNLRDLKAIKIWLPERALQEKFATIVKQVESTKEQYQKSLDELRDLFGSLSQRAFRGELDLEDKKKVSALDFKVELGKSVANSLSVESKIKGLGVNNPLPLSIGSAVAKAQGIVKLDGLNQVSKSSLLGEEYKSLHEKLSSLHSVKISDMFSSMDTPFSTSEQLSKNLIGKTFELDDYTKGMASSYFETWRKEEERKISDLISRPTLGLSSSELWSNKISNAISGSSALSNLESVYGVTSKVSFDTKAIDMWKHENEKLQALQISKIKDLGVKLPKFEIDTSLGIGSKLVEDMRKAEGMVKIDALSKITGASLVGKEYNALHETLSSFGRAKMTDIFPSMSESLASSFMTNEQFSKSLLGNALELDKYTKALTSNYFKTWKQEEEDRLSNLIARPTLGLSSSELWKNKISDAIGSSALSNLESVYGVNSAIETMNMWKHENERLQALQVPDYFKVEQEKFEQLAGLGKYDEHIRNFTKEHESLFNPPSSSAFDTSAIYGAESIKELNSKMETLSLEALDKSFEVDQPYKLALEQMEAMNPLRDWGERHEARINRYSEKLEETTKVIESIPNLSELMDDEFFDNISWKDSYDNIKELVYRLIDEGKLEQVFDEDEEKIILVKVER